MLIEVKVPQLSESVSEAMLVTWHRQVGDAVKRDENLVDIETDKVVLETPAPESGVLVSIVKGDGSAVGSGEVIATIDTEAKAGKAAAAKPETPKAAKETAPPGKPSENKVVSVERPAKAEVLPLPESKPAVKPTPKIAAVPPPAPLPKRAPAAPTASAGERPEQRVPMSRLRARIAERLVQSQQTTAMLTTFNEANMQPVIDIRNRYKEKFEQEHGVKLGFMSFFVKAAVAALKEYTIVNASVDGNDIIYHGYYDIGVAVSTPRGLVVPVLRDADRLSLADIERRIADFGARARDGKLDLEELAGGTFTISNGGVFGSLLSTPIINPPQSAILGVHAIKERPVVEDGRIVARPMTYLALSYDHRIIDGREAVLFLVAIKEALEDPARLLLEI
ncbi:MAG TPA: 2-oxoglutarate dehydrogenase complex dihydrolipoyllysine-residue succinyltransferase [Burkholderiales bacterium]|nr:2-oxoglutarate dehydrogenase complex dihydrolipoyllysine-residue succinyltransferase [Burkholderiales bacterium]